MTIAGNLPQLPFPRPDIFTIAPQYVALQRDSPVSRVRTPVDDEGWLVTSYSDVKRLISDGSLGRAHHEPAAAARYSTSAFEGGPLGDDPDAEDARYQQMRGLVSSAFAPARTRAIHADIEKLVDGLFDELMSTTDPVDFHAVVSCQLPVMVACRLLGVPGDDRDQFRDWFEATTALYDSKRVGEGFGALARYTQELVLAKKEEPREDLISDIVASRADSELDSLPIIVAGLLYAAYETTVERLDHGTLLLLSDVAQQEALRATPSLLAGAVDEVLRVAAPSRPPRILYAREAIELRGRHIDKGDLVMLSISAANHDPEVFAQPHRFDPRRSPNPHLSFGYGLHFCIGAALARAELELVLARVVQYTPRLRLAVSAEDLMQYENPATGGMYQLPLSYG